MRAPFANRSSRRAFLRTSFGVALSGVLAGNAAFASDSHGVIKPPRPLPNLMLRCQDGRSATLKSLASGHVTAVQLMFTTCTSTCPMQGAIFERVQRLMPQMEKQHIQLISLSIDPKSDTPKALTEWLSMFHAGGSWIGAAPAVQDLAAMRSFFGVGEVAFDPHSTQTFILDRAGDLVFRTGELPPPEQIAAVLRRI